MADKVQEFREKALSAISLAAQALRDDRVQDAERWLGDARSSVDNVRIERRKIYERDADAKDAARMSGAAVEPKKASK